MTGPEEKKKVKRWCSSCGIHVNRAELDSRWTRKTRGLKMICRSKQAPSKKSWPGLRTLNFFSGSRFMNKMRFHLLNWRRRMPIPRPGVATLPSISFWKVQSNVNLLINNRKWFVNRTKWPTYDWTKAVWCIWRDQDFRSLRNSKFFPNPAEGSSTTYIHPAVTRSSVSFTIQRSTHWK